MSTNTFLKLGDIEGESTISGFEKQMELINIVSCGFTSSVEGNFVPYLILNNEHTNFLQLRSQLFDVKT